MSQGPTTIDTISLPSDQNSSGRQFGQEELDALRSVIDSGTLTSTKGSWVKTLEERFAKLIGVKQAFACSSGTAALHVAVAAVDPEPGDEIITTSITDMGAITPILYQGAIPVFADVDPETYNVTAESIERCISDRTKAIMVTHLFGNPCEMTKIMDLARKHNLLVIEDCAQAFQSEHHGESIGAIGDISCFSLQQGKHITTGEGGIVCSNNSELARRSFLIINKAWGYGDTNPDHYFLALNYRMNELSGAVAVAQLEKLDKSVNTRIELADQLTDHLEGIPGVQVPKIHPGNKHTYWKYCLRVCPDVIEGGTDGMAAALKERGIFSAPRYIQKPAFHCQVIRDQVTFGKSQFPFTLARPEAVDYDAAKFPGTFDALAKVLVLPWNECYTSEHIHFIANAVKEVAASLKKA